MKSTTALNSRSMIRRRIHTLLLTSATCLVLSACGGGGSSSAPAPVPVTVAQPSATISAAPSAVLTGQPITLTWSSQNSGATGCDASGAWSGQVGLSGTQVITPSTPGNTTFTITCGSAASSVSVPVTAAPAQASNTVAVTLDSGPSTSVSSLNVPFVSVTICRPGTSVCQTIDHVMVDTGSYGLRLIAPVDASLGLPALAVSGSTSTMECAQFISGYTWGGVFQADVKLGGEVAPTQSIQLLGSPQGNSVAAPSACTSTGANIGTVAALGANGILGVGLLRQDCGTACVTSAISATYYACTGSSCASTRMPLAQQVSNPVFAFATDNNGIVLTLPSVAANGATTLAGTLAFGIGTQTDNTIVSEIRYAADASGNFTTIFNGRTMTASFLDSGSNGLFFNDTALPSCSLSTGFYCPISPLTLTAVNQAFDGSASGNVSFTLSDVDTLGAGVVAAPVGGTNGGRHSSGANAFDWGLPFFFGRRVFVGFEGTPGGPYWAY
jgi:hypothetical protein